MKRYLVDKDKIIESGVSTGKFTKEQMLNMNWIHKLNGREAYFIPELNITVVDGYHIHRNWCRELEVIK